MGAEQHDDGQVDCTSDEVDEYNLGLAVASVFILLAVSLVGSTAPMALSRAKCGTVNTLIKVRAHAAPRAWWRACVAAPGHLAHCLMLLLQQQLARPTGSVQRGREGGRLHTLAAAAACPPVRPQVGTFAGSGVVLATALIHVLLPANEYLTNECLPDFWHRYEAWAFMFCTATIIVFQVRTARARCAFASFSFGVCVCVRAHVCVGGGGRAMGHWGVRQACGLSVLAEQRLLNMPASTTCPLTSPAARPAPLPTHKNHWHRCRMLSRPPPNPCCSHAHLPCPRSHRLWTTAWTP